ncbi:MAG: 30S ribosomal protein S20 [Candidatus Paceibacterota bacterium]
MPNVKAAKKDLKQTAVRTARNLAAKKELKETIKDYKKALEADQKKAQELLPTVFKKLDKAAKNNLIKENAASRMKSRLSRKLAVK